MINEKGQTAPGTIILAIVISLFLFVAGVLLIPFITPSIDEARIALDCAGIPSTSGGAITCLAVSATLPYYILVFVSTAAGYITARFLI